jgi:hypothetical protein
VRDPQIRPSAWFHPGEIQVLTDLMFSGVWVVTVADSEHSTGRSDLCQGETQQEDLDKRHSHGDWCQGRPLSSE